MAVEKGDKYLIDRSRKLFLRIFKQSPEDMQVKALDYLEKKEPYAQFIGDVASDALVYLHKGFPNTHINRVAVETMLLLQNNRLSFSIVDIHEYIHFAPDMKARGYDPKGLIALPSALPIEFHDVDQAFIEMAHLVFASSLAVDELRHHIFNAQILDHRAAARVAEYALSMEDMLMGWQLPTKLYGFTVGRFPEGFRSLPKEEQ